MKGYGRKERSLSDPRVREGARRGVAPWFRSLGRKATGWRPRARDLRTARSRAGIAARHLRILLGL